MEMFIAILFLLAQMGFVPACVEEDQNGFCYWNASEAGNGLGNSFVVIGETVYYAN